MRTLKLNQKYSREEVHSIFSPDTNFTPSAGTWGLRGIIRIPERENDFVFFVTYGQKQGEHEFDEGVHEGILTWQSQPAQTLEDKVIQQLIAHNELTDNIYLFLRENKKDKYSYFGRLKYLTHDNSRQEPVYFQWQLMESDDYNAGALEVDSEEFDTEEMLPIVGQLVESTDLPSMGRKGTSTGHFRGKKSPDYAAKEARNRKLGLAGELLVLKYEKQRLLDLGFDDLSGQVEHTSVVIGDGTGYDIKSFNVDGSVMHIEVKTTGSGIDTEFFMSRNEVRFSEAYSNSFYLYRLYDFSKSDGVAKFYVIEGDVMKCCDAQPTGFRLKYRSLP